MTGDWEAWLRFFLEGVYETAEQSVNTAKRILQRFQEDLNTISQTTSARSALRLHHYMQKRPIFTISSVSKETGMTQPTIHSAITLLIKAGIVQQLGKARRNRVFAYIKYVDILGEGTEPIERDFFL